MDQVLAVTTFLITDWFRMLRPVERARPSQPGEGAERGNTNASTYLHKYTHIKMQTPALVTGHDQPP